MARCGRSGETQRIHIKHHRHILRQGGFREHLLDVVRELPGLRTAQGDLEPELAVGADERGGEHLADGDAERSIFREPVVQRLQGELGTALVAGTACENGTVRERRDRWPCSCGKRPAPKSPS